MISCSSEILAAQSILQILHL